MKKWRHIAKLIKENRLTKGLTQTQLEELAIVGGSCNGGQHISNVERGKGNLPPKHAAKVCTVLAITPSVMYKTMVLDCIDHLYQYFPGLECRLDVVQATNLEVFYMTNN